jgi:putative holliday junction resolvase
MLAMHSTSLYLGVDFGTKRIGLAVGQTLTLTATPLYTLMIQSHTIWEAFTKIVSEWQPKGFVVGLALQPDGSHSTTSLAASEFGRHLSKRFGIPTYFTEERLTSVQARQYLKDHPSLTKKYDKDSLAAAIILESWLHSTPKEIQKDASLQSSI